MHSTSQPGGALREQGAEGPAPEGSGAPDATPDGASAAAAPRLVRLRGGDVDVCAAGAAWRAAGAPLHTEDVVMRHPGWAGLAQRQLYLLSYVDQNATFARAQALGIVVVGPLPDSAWTVASTREAILDSELQRLHVCAVPLEADLKVSPELRQELQEPSSASGLSPGTPQVAAAHGVHRIPVMVSLLPDLSPGDEAVLSQGSAAKLDVAAAVAADWPPALRRLVAGATRGGKADGTEGGDNGDGDGTATAAAAERLPRVRVTSSAALVEVEACREDLAAVVRWLSHQSMATWIAPRARVVTHGHARQQPHSGGP